MVFLLESLKELVWEKYPLPKVVIADQGNGLISALSTTMPQMQLQLCEWHAFQNIKKRLTDKGYTKEKRQDLYPLVWSYLQAGTIQGLKAAKRTLLTTLKHSEVLYIEQN
jgi:hypothetical protein